MLLAQVEIDVSDSQFIGLDTASVLHFYFRFNDPNLQALYYTLCTYDADTYRPNSNLYPAIVYQKKLQDNSFDSNKGPNLDTISLGATRDIAMFSPGVYDTDDDSLAVFYDIPTHSFSKARNYPFGSKPGFSPFAISYLIEPEWVSGYSTNYPIKLYCPAGISRCQPLRHTYPQTGMYSFLKRATPL
ncbi:MAG: hypothetical protein H6606_02130 [Flavobacteriales bacterium]|nr:hypothetical protein [Flavobacteriales bacterium]